MSEFCPYTYKSNPTELEFPWRCPMPSYNERDVRWRAIRKAMGKNNIECLIVSTPFGYMPTPDNCLYYISNYVPFFSLGVYLIFPLVGEPQLYVSTALGPQFQHVASQTSWIKDVIGTIYPARDIVRKIKQLKLENSR